MHHSDRNQIWGEFISILNLKTEDIFFLFRTVRWWIQRRSSEKKNDRKKRFLNPFRLRTVLFLFTLTYILFLLKVFIDQIRMAGMEEVSLFVESEAVGPSMQTSKTFPGFNYHTGHRLRLFARLHDGLLPGEIYSRWTYA
jgi:hypothetical protein